VISDERWNRSPPASVHGGPSSTIVAHSRQQWTRVKKALIAGITGQDDSSLAELPLGKGNEVHGLIRRSSSFSTGRIDHLYRDQERGRPRAPYVTDGRRTMLLPLVIRGIRDGGFDATSPYGYPGPVGTGTDDPTFLRVALVAGRGPAAVESSKVDWRWRLQAPGIAPGYWTPDVPLVPSEVRERGISENN
jgi:hypothetical protein